MEKIVINESELSYRYTPWDEKSFEMETREILSINYKDENELSKLITEFERTLKSGTLVYFRSDSNDQTIKKVMISNGYYIAETSMLMKLARYKKVDFSKIYKNNLPLENKINDADILELQKIAYNSFNYSRFHEDPFLNQEKARQRYSNWILELVKQGKEIFIYRQKGEIISFLFYDIENNKVNLILGGSKNGYGMMTLYFFSTIMTYFQKTDIKKLEVMISASNIGILNTYIKFGFTDEKTFFDYHKVI